MDRLSNLPDHLLITIISYLAFNEAIRTSVLSRRWPHLWRSTSTLDFNEAFFANVDADNLVRRQVFVDFVRRWIQNDQQHPITKFSLTLSQPGDFLLVVEQCIAFSLNRNVKHLSLDFSDPTWDENDLDGPVHSESYELPPQVYDHQILESLKLFSCKFNVEGFMNFGFLKNLSLGWIELRDSTVKALLVYCGNLESLSLKNCWNMDCLEFGGEELKLKSLVVRKCRFLGRNFQIVAPNLKVFKYTGTTTVFYMNSGNGLKEAELVFDGFEDESACNESMGDLLYQMLQQIYPSRALTVCTLILQVVPLGEESASLKPPLNVTQLTLKTALHDYEQTGIQFFFNSCPHLETLQIDIGPGRIFVDEFEAPYPTRDRWIRRPIVFACVAQTLREVRINGFKGTPNEVYVLTYLLRFGRVIQTLTIVASEEIIANNPGNNPALYRRRAQQVVENVTRASPNMIITII